MFLGCWCFSQRHSLSPCLWLIIMAQLQASLQAVNEAAALQKDYCLIFGITELPHNAPIGWSVTESFHLNSERDGKLCQRPQLLFIFSRCGETLSPQFQPLLPRGPMLGHVSLRLVNITPSAARWLAAARAVGVRWREMLKDRVYLSSSGPVKNMS